jgi:hypothetical protein
MPDYVVPPISRLIADRRGGVDRRTTPRRQVVASVAVDVRRVVDPRRGAERRSTLDRRGRSARVPSVESPGEHLRNALQLLAQLHTVPEVQASHRADLAAVLRRLERALQLLERRASP